MTANQTTTNPMVFTLRQDAKYEINKKECTLLEYLEENYGARGSGSWSLDHSTSPSTIKFFTPNHGMEWDFKYG